MKIRWKLSFGILGVFLAGMITSVLLIGILVAKESKRGAEDPKVGERRLLKTMTKSLELDEEQQGEVAGIVADIVTDTRSEIGDVIDSHSPRIREILRPEQDQQFTDFLLKVEEHLHVELKSAEAK